MKSLKSPKEYWKDKFGEYPQSDSDELAIKMMWEYLEYIVNTDPNTDEQFDKSKTGGVVWMINKFAAFK